VIRVLRDSSPATVESIAQKSGHSTERVAQAVSALYAEGMIKASPAALRGSPRGSVRLPE
jgi:predicted transcriptional regulator